MENQELKTLVFSCVVNLLFIGFFSFFNFSYASPDSFYNILAGRAFAVNGWQADPSHYVIWGAYLAFLQSASPLLGLEYLYGLIPAVALSFLFSIVSLFFLAFKIDFGNGSAKLRISFGESSIQLALPTLLTCIAMIFIFSTPYVQRFTVYLHSNWITAIYLTFLLLAIWIALRTHESKWLPVIGLSTLGVTLCRVESMFMIAVPIFLFLQKTEITPKKIRWTFVPIMTLNFLWSIQKMIRGLAMAGNKGNDAFLYGAIGYFFIMILLIYVYPMRDRLNLPWKKIIFFGFSLLFIASVLWQTSLMSATLKSMYYNLTDMEQWSLVWAILPALLVVAIASKAQPHEDFYLLTTFSYCVLLVVFAAVRGTAYRVGWFDSGNRMMLHLFPTIVFYTFYKIGCLLVDPVSETNQEQDTI